ncbi:O-methyltransferase [Paenibacillaceae bacterium]|nr:O-methyltransferase [Paenibacillaceae bacterium]
MNLEGASLARQVDYVFRQLEDELKDAIAGTVTIQVRNNAIGKFGMRHHPIESRNGLLHNERSGMTTDQVLAFRQMAVDALKYKRNWTHGEIIYDFAVRPTNNTWSASVQFESNYNTANWMFRYHGKNQYRESN